MAAILATYGTSAYASSKTALGALINNLRQELGKEVDFVLLPIGQVNTSTATDNMVPKNKSSWISPEVLFFFLFFSIMTNHQT